MTKKTSNGFKIMRRQSFAHMLILYTNTNFDFVEEYA